MTSEKLRKDMSVSQSFARHSHVGLMHESVPSMSAHASPLSGGGSDPSQPVSGEATATADVRWSKLVTLLESVYGEAILSSAWLARLRERVNAFALSRPAALRVIDAQRSAEPNWFLSQSQLGYIAYVDRFGVTQHPDGTKVSALRGVIDRVDHLKLLGVTYLHLLPFMRARAGENDGGFAVSSFTDVDPRLGNNDDLIALASALREANITLCVDMVLNHVADDHPWAIAAKNGDAKCRGYFRVLDSAEEVAEHEVSLNQVFPQNAPGNFTYVEALGGCVWTTFFPYQWDLNYCDPDVFAEIVCAMLQLANTGVGAFRLDSTAFLWKVKGTSCTNLPQVHLLLQAMRAIFEIVAPSVLLKAEAIMPRRDLPAYLGRPAGDAATMSQPECHLAYQSAAMAALWLALAEGNTSVLTQVLSDVDQLPSQSSWVTYVRCHDDIVWGVLKPEFATDAEAQRRLRAVSEFFTVLSGGYARGESFQSAAAGGVHGTNGMTASLVGLRGDDGLLSAQGLARWRLMFDVIFAINGMPLIYMGDELGQENASPDHIATLSATEDGRFLHRPMFDEMARQRAYARPISSTIEPAVLNSIANLARVRRSLDSLAANTPLSIVPTANSALIAFTRGDSFLLVANFSDRKQAPSISLLHTYQWQDALTRENFDATTVTDAPLALEPWECRWLVKR
jgi:amylosucrase